jgi:hypothetical protein
VAQACPVLFRDARPVFVTLLITQLQLVSHWQTITVSWIIQDTVLSYRKLWILTDTLLLPISLIGGEQGFARRVAGPASHVSPGFLVLENGYLKLEDSDLLLLVLVERI